MTPDFYVTSMSRILDELSGQKLDDLTKRIVSDFHDRQKGMD
jgi:hypothetical protein